MLMHISLLMNPFYLITYFFQIHGTVDFFDRLFIRWLNSNFQLNESWTQTSDQLNLFLIQKICCHFKMKICNPFIMLFDIIPDCHRMIMLTVKCSVNKLNLWHFMINKELQFFLHKFQVTESKTFINWRKTITTRKRTSSARLIINDTVLEILNITIDKRYFAQIHNLSRRCRSNLFFLFPKCDSLNIDQLSRTTAFIICHKFCKSLFTLSAHDTFCHWIFFQNFSCIIRNFRTSKPDLRIRQNLWNLLYQLSYFCHIP